MQRCGDEEGCAASGGEDVVFELKDRLPTGNLKGLEARFAELAVAHDSFVKSRLQRRSVATATEPMINAFAAYFNALVGCTSNWDRRQCATGRSPTRAQGAKRKRGKSSAKVRPDAGNVLQLMPKPDPWQPR